MCSEADNRRSTRIRSNALQKFDYKCSNTLKSDTIQLLREKKPKWAKYFTKTPLCGSARSERKRSANGSSDIINTNSIIQVKPRSRSIKRFGKNRLLINRIDIQIDTLPSKPIADS